MLVGTSQNLYMKIELRIEKDRWKGRWTEVGRGQKAGGSKEGRKEKREGGRVEREAFSSGINLLTPNQSHSILQQDESNWFMFHTGKLSSPFLVSDKIRRITKNKNGVHMIIFFSVQLYSCLTLPGLQKPLLTLSCSGTRFAFLYCRLTMWELGCQGLELFSAVAACESSRFPYVTPINSLVLPSSDCWNLSLILNLVLFELKKFLLFSKESQ